MRCEQQTARGSGIGASPSPITGIRGAALLHARTLGGLDGTGAGRRAARALPPGAAVTDFRDAFRQ